MSSQPIEKASIRANAVSLSRNGQATQAMLDVMAKLRNPEGGCPWDLEQNFATIAPYTIEEAYEVADAIEREDMAALKEELGDLLFQVAFHARMAEEQGAFDYADVANGLAAKMIERHWDGIAAYCQPDNKVALGFVEGFNNKIRVIQRRAYGLRDEEYLRLKILTCMMPQL